MLSTFPRSSHALATERGRGMAAGILVAALLLSVWLAWGCLARLVLYEVADTARIEVGRAVHVAIVGASGAGKSSLVGTLLGWHRPTAGRVLIDGQVLDGQRLEQLHRHTAWVDPAVQLYGIAPCTTIFTMAHLKRRRARCRRCSSKPSCVAC